jgi:hypothetical protein
VLLLPGSYHLSGLVRAQGIEPRDGYGDAGVALYVVGEPRQQRVFGNSDWKSIGHDFAVELGPTEVELACEFRGTRGEAWVDRDSLSIQRR